MTRGVEGIDISASANDAAQKMKRLNVGALPVFEHGRVAGIVTDRDLVTRILADPSGARWTPITKAMSDRTVSVGEESDLEDAIKLMASEGVSRLLVENEAG
ncbi:MAG: CBS domain-containing protein, partial [Fimbriimonadales bacterium]